MINRGNHRQTLFHGPEEFAQRKRGQLSTLDMAMDPYDEFWENVRAQCRVSRVDPFPEINGKVYSSRSQAFCDAFKCKTYIGESDAVGIYRSLLMGDFFFNDASDTDTVNKVISDTNDKYPAAGVGNPTDQLDPYIGALRALKGGDRTIKELGFSK